MNKQSTNKNAKPIITNSTLDSRFKEDVVSQCTKLKTSLINESDSLYKIEELLISMMKHKSDLDILMNQREMIDNYKKGMVELAVKYKSDSEHLSINNQRLYNYIQRLNKMQFDLSVSMNILFNLFDNQSHFIEYSNCLYQFICAKTQEISKSSININEWFNCFEINRTEITDVQNKVINSYTNIKKSFPITKQEIPEVQEAQTSTKPVKINKYKICKPMLTISIKSQGLNIFYGNSSIKLKSIIKEKQEIKHSSLLKSYASTEAESTNVNASMNNKSSNETNYVIIKQEQVNNQVFTTKAFNTEYWKERILIIQKDIEHCQSMLQHNNESNSAIGIKQTKLQKSIESFNLICQSKLKPISNLKCSVEKLANLLYSCALQLSKIPSKQYIKSYEDNLRTMTDCLLNIHYNQQKTTTSVTKLVCSFKSSININNTCNDLFNKLIFSIALGVAELNKQYSSTLDISHFSTKLHVQHMLTDYKISKLIELKRKSDSMEYYDAIYACILATSNRKDFLAAIENLDNRVLANIIRCIAMAGNMALPSLVQIVSALDISNSIKTLINPKNIKDYHLNIPAKYNLSSQVISFTDQNKVNATKGAENPKSPILSFVTIRDTTYFGYS